MTVIAYGPSGSGKTARAQEVAARYGCVSIVDEFNPATQGLTPNALHLMHEHPGRDFDPDVLIVSMEDEKTSGTHAVSATISAAVYRVISAPCALTASGVAVEVLAGLKAEGFAIVPIEPDTATLLKMAEQYDFAGWPSAYRAMVEQARAGR